MLSGKAGADGPWIDALVTAYGPAATDLLAEQITRAKDGDPLAEVTVVVASNYAGVAIRRELAARPGGLAAVTFTTLARVAERLGSARLAAAGRRPVSGPVLAAAIRQVLEVDPGRFAPVADHPATELALVSAARELAGLTEEALDGLAGTGGLASDVVRVHRQAREALAGGWYDEADLIAAATGVVEAGGVAGAAVIVHLLQHPSAAEARLLRALAGVAPLRVNVGLTGEADADRPVIEAHRRAGIEVPGAPVERPVCSRIVSVSDPDEEVRGALRLIAGWMRDGVPLGRMAVLYGPAEPYARLLHEHLEAAGIPHSGAPVRTLGEMFLGRTVRALLGLADGDFRRDEVLGLVSGSGLLDGDRPAPARAWERVSRDAGVVCGSDWTGRLQMYAARRRLTATEARRDEDEPRARRLSLDAEQAERLQSFVGRLRSDLEALHAAGSWRSLSDAVTALLDKWVGGERRRQGWPDEELRAAERVEQAVERLAGLDQLGGAPPGLDVFRRALDAELELALRRVGRLGDGVLVAPVGSAVGVRTARTVVLGMAEGSFPVQRVEDSLLPDEVRRAGRGELKLRSERLHDDHRHLLAAVAGSEQAVLVFPRGDLRRSTGRPASRWLLADAAVLAGRPALFTDDLAGLAAPWFEAVASHAAGIASTDFPATAQDLRLSGMLSDPSPVMAADAVLRGGMALARARRSARFTRFDGHLTGAELPDYTAGTVTSATRLQEWARCPHAFFMNHLLGVEAVEEPETRLEMSALEKGTLMHRILERFIAGQIPGGSHGPWEGAARELLERIAEEECQLLAAQGLSGRGVFWRRDRARIVKDLARFAREDTGRPLRTELSFEGAPYPLPDGRSVAFRGSIDRVDDGGADALTVLDYKTGGLSTYRDLAEGDPHLGGRHLQLAVYAAAARHVLGRSMVEAYYWFTTDKGGFRRLGYPVGPQVEKEVGAAIAAIVDGIRSGIFPRRPSADPPYHYVDCRYCSPDGLSTAETRREWERKRAHPVLRDYIELVEPEALAGGR